MSYNKKEYKTEDGIKGIKIEKYFSLLEMAEDYTNEINVKENENFGSADFAKWAHEKYGVNEEAVLKKISKILAELGR